MSNVNSYVNVMRKAGAMRVNSNPNSEMSMLKGELVEHYKSNPLKAWALINDIESNISQNVSEGQRLHYDAAVIAVRGYSSAIKAEPKASFVPQTQISELDKLQQAGWSPLNKSQLLTE